MIELQLSEHDLAAPTPPPTIIGWLDQQQARVDAATGGESA